MKPATFDRGARVLDRISGKLGTIVDRAQPVTRGWLIQLDGETMVRVIGQSWLSLADAADELIDRLSRPAAAVTLVKDGVQTGEKAISQDQKPEAPPATTPQSRSVRNEIPGFTPRITVEPSKMNPGGRSWTWHFPDGRKEQWGATGTVALSASRERYIEALEKRYRLKAEMVIVSLDDVSGSEASTASNPTVEKSPLSQPPLLNSKPGQLSINEETRRTGKTQGERVFDAFVQGAKTNADVARMVGIDSSIASAVTCALIRKGRVEKCGVSEEGKAMYQVKGWVEDPLSRLREVTKLPEVVPETVAAKEPDSSQTRAEKTPQKSHRITEVAEVSPTADEVSAAPCAASQAPLKSESRREDAYRAVLDDIAARKREIAEELEVLVKAEEYLGKLRDWAHQANG